MRIFPGKKTYDDEHAAERRLVFAVIEFTEDPPEGTTKMWFRLWDVDDPSADSAPIDEAGSPDPGTNGPDNRDSSWAMAGAAPPARMVLVSIGTIKRFSGEEEIADPEKKKRICKVAVRVGMQPGDNWRFCGAREVNENALRGMTQNQADRVQPPGGVNESEMLTTWRKLHMEIDSMPEEPDEYPQKSPDIKEVYPVSAAGDHPWPGVTTLYLSEPIGAPDEDHYEGGYIRGQQGPTWRVVNHTENLIDPDEIIILGVPGVPEIYMLMGLCRLADDDEPDPQLPLFPGVGPVIVSRFGKAYIEPVAVDDGENTNKIVPEFYLNLGYWDIFLFRDWTARDLAVGLNDYWVAYVVMGYQGENKDPFPLPPLPRSHYDLDPDGYPNFYPDPLPGWYRVAYEEGWYGGEHKGYATVFVETSRDAAVTSVAPSQWPSVDEIMTHETGHLGGAPDREHTIMDATTGMKAPDWFADEDITTFRTNTYFKPIDGF